MADDFSTFPSDYSLRGTPPLSIEPVAEKDERTIYYESLSHILTESFPSLSTSETSGTPSIIQPGVISQAHETLQTLIEQVLQEVNESEKNLKNLEQTAKSSTCTRTTSTIVQTWISDYVLKGGASSAKTGIPLLLHAPQAVTHLLPVSEFIKFFTDILDIGTGFGLIIYKRYLLDAALGELKGLKSKIPTLLPDQVARLKQIEKALRYERKIFQDQTDEQQVRAAKNLFSYATFALSWISHNPLMAALTEGANSFISGVNAALFGLYFYRARRDLQYHREWSKDYKAWMKKQTSPLKVGEESSQAMKNTGMQLLAKRKVRLESKISSLKKELQEGTFTKEKLNQGIREIKRPSVQKFVEGLDEQTISSMEFQEKLENQLGVKLDSSVVIEILQERVQLKVIQKSEDLAEEAKQEKIESIKAKINHHLDACLDVWIESQSEDTLLSSYVDYHAVLNTAIKGSLMEMVTKKHQLEKGFLKLKQSQQGIKFTAATIFFGIALTLAIIGLLSTPVGAAALILMILTIASTALSTGLFVAGYYYSYKQKPLGTIATLQGDYVRLSYYQMMENLSSVSDSIGDYLKVAYQTKRDQLALWINQLPLFSRSKTNDAKEIAKKEIEKEFQEKQTKAQIWKKQADALKEELEAKGWQDFAKQADLKVAAKKDDDFDTLETFHQLLTQCNLDLLSSSTKNLIEKQLGIHIISLQKEIDDNPSAVREMLRNFFIQDDTSFVKFVGHQRLTA